MQKIVSFTFLAFLLLFGVYVALAIMPPDMLPSIDRERLISNNLSSIASEGWSFARPLLQLAFIILIFEYVVSKYGDTFKMPRLVGTDDVKALLAVIVVGAFCVAALAGSEFSGMLKDASLVIIGFYFGGAVAGRQAASG